MQEIKKLLEDIKQTGEGDKDEYPPFRLKIRADPVRMEICLWFLICIHKDHHSLTGYYNTPDAFRKDGDERIFGMEEIFFEYFCAICNVLLVFFENFW